MKKLLLAATVLTASSAAFAAGPQYTYVQGQWQESEIDQRGWDRELDGFGFAGSLDLNNEFFAFAQYASVDHRDVEAERFAIGGAYKMPISPRTDLNFGAGIVSYDTDPEVDEDDSGLLLTAAIRSMVNNQLELGAGMSYEDALDADLLVNVYGAWHFNTSLSAGLSLTEGDIETTAIYVRMAF